MVFHRDLFLVGGLVRVSSLPLLLRLGCVGIPFLARFLGLDGVDLLGEDGNLLLEPGGDVGSFIVGNVL